MTLACLHRGIDIPECGALVPWLVTPRELREHLLPAVPSTSPAGWPVLRFTCLGVTAEFGFNFVTHPEHRLLGVRFDEPATSGNGQALTENADALRARLGEPNVVDRPGHMMWRDDRVWVDYSVRTTGAPARTRTLEVYFHAGVPRAWVPPSERALGELKRLLERLPGVVVVRVQLSPRGAHLDLTVDCPHSLAWLAHAMCATNVPFWVAVDWYRLSNRGTLRAEPGDVVYRIEFPGSRAGEPLTGLQTVGIHLTHELRERRALEEHEATWLLELFHNRAAHEPGASSRPIGDS